MNGILVINKETGQTLTSNILCRPEEKNLLETYEKYNDKLLVKLEDLPTCKTFTPNKLEYQSLWESIFVKPLAWLILKLGYLVKNMGISVIIIGLLIRLIMMPLQIKTVKQSENMKKAQSKLITRLLLAGSLFFIVEIVRALLALLGLTTNPLCGIK